MPRYKAMFDRLVYTFEAPTPSDARDIAGKRWGVPENGRYRITIEEVPSEEPKNDKE